MFYSLLAPYGIREGGRKLNAKATDDGGIQSEEYVPNGLIFYLVYLVRLF